MNGNNAVLKVADEVLGKMKKERRRIGQNMK